jgi:hypothetical protein
VEGVRQRWVIKGSLGLELCTISLECAWGDNGGDVSFVVINLSCSFDCAGLPKGDLGGIPFAGLVPLVGALAIWSKDPHELEVECRLEFSRLRAGKGGLPCSTELADPSPATPFVSPTAFLLGLMLRNRSFPAPPFPLLPGPALAFFKTFMTLFFSNCSSALFIVCATILARNDWRINGDVTWPGRTTLQVCSWMELEDWESQTASELRLHLERVLWRRQIEFKRAREGL